MSSERAKNLSAAEAIARLQEGNQRYTSDTTVQPRRDAQRRNELTSGQSPFATIITCADSRVPPEVIFDEGLGDLFVIRVAGNVSDDAVLGSIEYASLHLGVNLVLVMGHQSCGAVGASVENKDVDGPATNSHIDWLIDAIRPAVERAAAEGSDNLLERSVRANASYVAETMRASEPILANLAKDGVEVRPAYYSLESGAVEWLD